jgi:hypothetical protein
MIYYVSESNLSLQRIMDENINPKEYYIKHNHLYFYFADPKNYDSENDYDFAVEYQTVNDKIQVNKNNITPIMINILQLKPSTKIHVFLEVIFENFIDICENLHKSKIYTVAYFLSK